jgi:hypothetical protein
MPIIQATQEAEILRSKVTLAKKVPGVVVYACNPNYRRIEVQGQS